MWRNRKASPWASARAIGADELLAHEPQEAAPDLGPTVCGGQGDHRGLVEDASHDRGALGHRPLVGGQPVQAGRQQGRDRRRHGDRLEIPRGRPAAVARHQRAVVDQGAEELLDVQGVALGRFRDPGPHRGRERAAGHERVDQLQRRPLGQRLEQDRRGVELAAAPGRAVVEELGTRRADEQDRRVAGEVGDRLEQVEQGRLGPVDVVDEDDERPLSRRGAPGRGGTTRRSPPAPPTTRGR